MKAIVQHRYGAPEEVLHLREIERPVEGDGDVLVRVHAASVHPDVWHAVTGRPYILRLMGTGLRKPKYSVPGIDMAGRVESIGKCVSRFAPGDAVFGQTLRGGINWGNGGALAEYVSVPEGNLALKPANVTFEQAAAVLVSGHIALMTLPMKRIKQGSRVLINGAGGGVGSVAVQLAKASGAHVTAVDSTTKLDMLRSLGADDVIDYTQESVLRRGERYDLIFDVASNLALSDCKSVFTSTGVYATVGHADYGARGGRFLGTIPRFLGLALRSPFDGHLLKAKDISIPNRQDVMASLKDLLEAGTLTPFVDRTYPLSEVAAALRYIQEGRVRGKVVIVL